MLPHPSIVPQLRVRIAALAASLLGFVIRMITTSSASSMSDFPMFTKRRSSFTHKTSLCYSGEI